MKLVILYSMGGLGDVGRHAVRAALERPGEIKEIKVLSQHTETLEDENWNCACPSLSPHIFTNEERERLDIVKIDSWEDDSLLSHFEGADAVITCLGNRQMTLGDRVGGEGSRMVVNAMNHHKISRAVVMSSMGINEDWPPLEFHWIGRVMRIIFLTCGKKDYRDLAAAEEAFQTSKDVDYLIIRPVALGEDVIPENKWLVQKQKYKDKSLAIGIAKLDCARFMVEEALTPTRHKTAIVIASPLPEKKER